MAEINAAYDLVRAAAQHEAQGPWRPGETTPADARPPARRGKGGWLIAPLRLALGPELLDTLDRRRGRQARHADVDLGAARAPSSPSPSAGCCGCSTTRPSRACTRCAFRNVAEIGHRVRRKHAALTVRTIAGRRHVFHDLRPHTAADDRATRAQDDRRG